MYNRVVPPAQPPSKDRALEAFRRLLSDARSSEQARVDAIVALAQRTVFVPTWPGTDTFRTLVNSGGVAALPLFSDERALSEASMRFGWMNPDGSIAYKEVGAREAFTFVVVNNLAFAVVDVHASHSLELDKHVMEPMLSATSRFNDAGPFAGTGRLSSTLMRAVRTSIAPPSVGAAKARDTGTTKAPSGAMPLPSGIAAQRSSDAGSLEVEALSQVPSDALLDALSDALRAFPEVEWACLFVGVRGQTKQTTLGLRVSAQFRGRYTEISAAAVAAAGAQNTVLDTCVIDEPALTKAVRSTALMFYPWRR